MIPTHAASGRKRRISALPAPLARPAPALVARPTAMHAAPTSTMPTCLKPARRAPPAPLPPTAAAPTRMPSRTAWRTPGTRAPGRVSPLARPARSRRLRSPLRRALPAPPTPTPGWPGRRQRLRDTGTAAPLRGRRSPGRTPSTWSRARQRASDPWPTCRTAQPVSSAATTMTRTAPPAPRIRTARQLLRRTPARHAWHGGTITGTSRPTQLHQPCGGSASGSGWMRPACCATGQAQRCVRVRAGFTGSMCESSTRHDGTCARRPPAHSRRTRHRTIAPARLRIPAAAPAAAARRHQTVLHQDARPTQVERAASQNCAARDFRSRRRSLGLLRAQTMPVARPDSPAAATTESSFVGRTQGAPVQVN